MPTHRLTQRLRDERGFSMIVVMMVMMVSGIFVVGAFAAADGDLPLGRESQDRKTAYAAAEAGLNYYAFKISQDNDYWNKCVTAAGPGGGQLNPVNQKWSGSGGDPRRWRPIPGSSSEYTIELLPAGSATQCVAGNQATMIDSRTGTFRVRASGRENGFKRSVIGTFKRITFLDFVYFTDYENLAPAAYSDSDDAAWAANNCVDYRPARHDNCTEIQFAEDDEINGPFHTNDSFLVCNNTKFGRTSADSIEVSAAAPGYTKVCSSSTNPNFQGTFRASQPKLTMPTTNSSLATIATSAYRYTGRTKIRLKGNVMDVTLANGTVQSNVALPANGVIYVSNGSGGCPSTSPTIADYAEGTGCGNVYVSGTYSQSLTIASANDIIVAPTDAASVVANRNDADILHSGDVVLGLIANGFVRVMHRVNRGWSSCSNTDTTTYPKIGNVQIDAAILSVNNSFIVDNYSCGSSLGTLSVFGGIAQRFRGVVARGSSGYVKDYNYDDRLRYRNPPFFLEPIQAAWNVVRVNEQVPAT